jgi:hypothetical protein
MNPSIARFIASSALFFVVVFTACSSFAGTRGDRLAPFFDRQTNPVEVSFPRERPVDITPVPPVLNAFDRAVLDTCGPLGSRVSRDQFQYLMRQHPQVLARVKDAVGGALRGDRGSNTQFLEDLTDIWFDRHGFEHIFCGEIEGNNRIGGLHFVGRYWELQDLAIAGRLPNNARREEVVPGAIYTLGVLVRLGDREIADDLKGYPYLTNAEEMLVEVTRAFKRQGSAEGACLLSVRDRETGTSYPAVFVKSRNAIVTFYPDATPRGRSCRR